MGLTVYMSRNPSKPAKPPRSYDENLTIAQIDVIKETLHILHKRGKPWKQSINDTQHNTKTKHDDSNVTKTNTMESPHDSNNPLNYQTKRQRGRPRKTKVESSKYSTQTKNNIDKHDTSTDNLLKNTNYNLRSSQQTFQAQLNRTNNDVTNNTQDTQQNNYTSAFAN